MFFYDIFSLKAMRISKHSEIQIDLIMISIKSLQIIQFKDFGKWMLECIPHNFRGFWWKIVFGLNFPVRLINTNFARIQFCIETIDKNVIKVDFDRKFEKNLFCSEFRLWIPSLSKSKSKAYHSFLFYPQFNKWYYSINVSFMLIIIKCW